MTETRKLKKRNLQKEESDVKRVGKIQRKKKEIKSNVDSSEVPLQVVSSERIKGKKVGLKKSKEKVVETSSSPADGKKMQKKRISKGVVSEITPEAISNEETKGKKSKLSKTKKNKRKADEINIGSVNGEDVLPKSQGKSKKSNKKRKTNRTSTKDTKESSQKMNETVEEEEVYQISSGDEDCSKGMKKWVNDYYDSRPGLDELQKRIDDFMTDHEERLEQEKQDREAKAAEGGWTVVVHHKGRKKTVDAESGIAVGSVNQTALEHQVAKKKLSEPVAHGFYRFQRREAQRNELLALRSKFEQDKKRIQQLRAARKFKPY